MTEPEIDMQNGHNAGEHHIDVEFHSFLSV